MGIRVRGAPVRWVVSVSLVAGVVVLLPTEAATAQSAAPAAAGSVPDVELSVGGAAHSVEAAGYFTGAVVSYGAVSGDVGVVAVSVSGSAVSLAPRGAGSATVTVTATNAFGGASQSFAVRVLPAGCVVALGVLAAGSIVAREGSWEAGGCRSVSAVDGGARYARYVSFTVSEPLEARFDLASSQRNRLYLLEGAGTGGAVLASAGALAATWAASLRRALQPGSYTLEATSDRPGREGDFGVRIDSMPLTPPPGCVASLGALTAGAAVTHRGSWARGDACRSVNATDNHESRYYARYVSFTVAEELRARFSLASLRGGRLFLLEGAGAAGRVLASATTRSSRAAATLGRVLAPGAYTLETAARQTEREGDFTLTASPELTAPRTAITPAPQAVAAGGTTAVDIAAAFTGTVDTYTATSSDASVVTVTTNGSILTLTGIAIGTATVTVTAANGAGRATQTIAVTVTQLAAPRTAGTLPAQTLTAGETATVDVASAFTGTVNSYTATSSDTATATASLTGSVLTLTGVAPGTATVTITATNTAGSATQTIAVTVASAAPTPVGALAAQTLTAGGSVEVDVAGTFGGTVDSYTVTSANGAVVDVALAGSVITLTGIAAGSATVTVVAANTAGSATQTIAVTVTLPPAPTLGAQLAPRTLQVTETLTVDIATGFNGRIDTYTATSGDTNKLTATADGPEVTLTGITAGSTTVTVTAINAAGRAARSFNVTVDPLAAPQTAAAPVARTIVVGERLPIHVADAFTGIIAAYTATSDKPSVVTATADGATVTLTGVAPGAATITLGAVNAAGTAAATLAVTVQEPDKLEIAVAAPSHCLGSEGVLVPGGGRRGVGSIDLTYHVTGGAGPYTITSPDTTQTATEPTGTLTVPCAQRGIDLTTATPTTNVVEAGPRTLTLTATDNTGTTTTTNIQIETAENAYTTEYNNGQMHPGKTYILGTPEQWVLITLPASLTLQFRGLSEHNVAHFTEPATGVEILLDWTTGTELGRTTPTTSDRTTRAKPPTRTTKQTSTTSSRTTTASVRRLKVTTLASLTYGANSTEWRPYAGLPNSYTIPGVERQIVPQVAVHPRMLIGQSIRVCADPANPQTAADDQKFKDNVKAGAKAWNDSVNHPITGFNPSFPRELFQYLSSCTSTTDPELNADLTVLRVEDTDIIDGGYCGNDVRGCAKIDATGMNPPTIGGSQIVIKKSLATDTRLMLHELGHFLGLGDYDSANDDKCGTDSSRQVDSRRPYFASVMAGGACWEDSIHLRDLVDLHLIYHPYARTGMHFDAVGASGWELNPGDPPRDTGRDLIKSGRFRVREYRYVSNAAAYVVFRRALGSVGTYRYVGSFSRYASKVIPGSHLALAFDREEIEGQIFYVFGVTGGDIEQSTHSHLDVHATLPLDLGSITGALGTRNWTLGHGETVYGPPKIPTNVRTETRSGEVDVVWPHVAGATNYDVYRHDTAEAIKQPTTTGGDPKSFLENLEVRASTRTSCGMRVTFTNLQNSRTYYFRVRANRDDVDLRGRLSAEVSGVPHATQSPPGSSAGHSGGVGKSASASSAESPVSCTLPEEVDPIKGDPFCPTNDGFSWEFREVVGGDAVCDRLEVDEGAVVSTVTYLCAASAGTTRVGPDGVTVCVREDSGTLRSRPGVPDCSEGFSLVTVLVGGAPQQICSKTDSEPATATTMYSCDSGYDLVTFFVQAGVSGHRCEKSVLATAATALSCEDGYSLVTVVLRVGPASTICRKSVPGTASTNYSCPPNYSLVTIQGTICYRSVPASSSTKYVCASGYSLVKIPLGGQVCRKTVSASSSTKYVCSSGYSLVTFFVQPGVVGYRCKKSVAAASLTKYVCASGYSLVKIPLGGQVCRKTVSATATYSCPTGYTRTGTSCYKYVYRSLTGASCPAGYTTIYNGLYFQCRKKLTAAATVTYSCNSGTLSGSRCVFTTTPTTKTTYTCSAGTTLSGSKCILTATPTSKTVYSCNSGTLSGSKCVFTATPTSRTVYSCSSGTLSGTRCTLTVTPTSKTTYSCTSGKPSGTKCVFTAAPTSKTTYSCSAGRLSGSECVLTGTLTTTVTYDCDDAPDGYTLSEQNCVKTTTQTPTPTTINYCDAGYTLSDENTCSRTVTTKPTKITTYSCPTSYQLTTTSTAAGTTRSCTRTITITIAAETGPPTCPAVPEGEDPYQLTTTTNSAGQTTYSCTTTNDDDETTLPPPLS